MSQVNTDISINLPTQVPVDVTAKLRAQPLGKHFVTAATES